jgi:2-polyprenyl-3-methyl-5-hydroxy-6-metoxy-1,4-benzoquinol methylase
MEDPNTLNPGPTDEDRTREKQYQFIIEQEKSEGLATLGSMSSQVWRDDPRRLGFVLARYKFVAKMLSGCQSALEIGCADAFGTRLVRQEVPNVTATDFDPFFIKGASRAQDPRWPITFKAHDMLEGPMEDKFDAAYAVDVIEHIPQEVELQFVSNIVASLSKTGILILGSPSIQSQAYASKASKEGHVNCKDAQGLKSLVGHFFHNVFIFSMNDEVLHTGFPAMAHYLFAIGCTIKS